MGKIRNRCLSLLLVFITVITCSSCGDNLDSYAKVQLVGKVYDLRDNPGVIFDKMAKNNLAVQYYCGDSYLWEDRRFKKVDFETYNRITSYGEDAIPRVGCLVQLCEDYPEDDIERLAKSRITYCFGAGDNTEYRVNQYINYDSYSENLYTREFEFPMLWDYYKKKNLRSIYDFNQYCLLEGFYTTTYRGHSLNAVFFDGIPVYLQDYAANELSEEKQNEYNELRKMMDIEHPNYTNPSYITCYYKPKSEEELEISRINKPIEEGFYNAMCEGLLKIHNGEISEVYGVTYAGYKYKLSIIRKDGQVLMKGENEGELIWK